MFAFHIRVLAKADIQEIVAFYDGHTTYYKYFFGAFVSRIRWH
jgi:hypothetical protein